VIIRQTKFFSKQKKKLHANQIQALDNTLKTLLNNSEIGEQKQGELKSIKVYKFKMVNQECLLAYEIMENSLVLHAVGPHENFYRDLKLVLK
jgi:mRNA-degrading endonuclease RelE of RelBE toxin-antitoxin system